MSAPVVAQAEGLVVAPRRGLRHNPVVVALLGAPQALVGGIVLAIVILIAVLAPWIAPYGEHERVGDVFAPRRPRTGSASTTAASTWSA